MLKRIIVDLFLFIAILVVVIQGQSILRRVSVVKLSMESPVTYSELIPEKEEYKPGDLVRFSYNRLCKVGEKDLPLLMLSNDSFENLDTGEIFVGVFGSRIVHRNGLESLHALRRLSPDCTPGTYSFEGWISIQSNVPIAPVPYFSRQFKVVAP